MIPFSPYSKSQLTVTKLSEKEKKVRVVLKGAPEVVINHCSIAMNKEMGDPIKFNDEIKK